MPPMLACRHQILTGSDQIRIGQGGRMRFRVVARDGPPIRQRHGLKFKGRGSLITASLW